MTLFNVSGDTYASVYIKVELSDDEIKDLSKDDIIEKVLDKFHDKAPSGLCVGCSGYSREWSRDIGDEYEITVSDQDHKVVYENDQLKGSFAENDSAGTSDSSDTHGHDRQS